MPRLPAERAHPHGSVAPRDRLASHDVRPRPAFGAGTRAVVLVTLGGVAAAAIDPPVAARDPQLTTRVASTARSRHFEFHSQVPVDFDELIWFAESARAELCTWLGVARVLPDDVIRVWIVDDTEAARWVEDRHGLLGPAERTREHVFRGRSHPAAGLIVLPAWSGPQMQWQLVHEIAHVVLGARTGGTPLVLDEGLAELVPSWILASDALRPEDVDARYALYERRLARAVLARELPSFERLVNATREDFHDPGARWLWHAAAWRLAKVLVESDDPRVGGRIHALLGEIAAARPWREALAHVHDLRVLESAWRASVEEVAPWRSMFGEWRLEHDSIVGRCTPGTSACAFGAGEVPAGEPFDAAFTCLGVPPAHTAYGFALEVSGARDFVYVEVRPGGRAIVVAERAGGEWVGSPVLELESTNPLATADPAGEMRIALRAEARGRLEVRVDGELVLRHDLGRPLRAGHVGFVVEHCGPEGPGSGWTEMEFVDVDLLRGPTR